jgi:hypothetical protein
MTDLSERSITPPEPPPAGTAGADLINYAALREANTLKDVNPEAIKVAGEEERAVKSLDHDHRMELLSFAALLVCFLTGVCLYAFNPRGETIGTALMTGPVGAFVDRSASAAMKKKRTTDGPG